MAPIARRTPALTNSLTQPGRASTFPLSAEEKASQTLTLSTQATEPPSDFADGSKSEARSASPASVGSAATELKGAYADPRFISLATSRAPSNAEEWVEEAKEWKAWSREHANSQQTGMTQQEVELARASILGRTSLSHLEQVKSWGTQMTSEEDRGLASLNAEILLSMSRHAARSCTGFVLDHAEDGLSDAQVNELQLRIAGLNGKLMNDMATVLAEFLTGRDQPRVGHEGNISQEEQNRPAQGGVEDGEASGP